MGEEIRKLSCHATILIRLHDTQSRRGSGIGSKSENLFPTAGGHLEPRATFKATADSVLSCYDASISVGVFFIRGGGLLILHFWICDSPTSRRNPIFSCLGIRTGFSRTQHVLFHHILVLAMYEIVL